MERAKADRCIHDNPCDGIELPRKQVRKHVYLSADELSRVAMQCGWREPIVLTLGLCGMRWGELVALRVEDVDLNAVGCIYIGASRVFPAGWWRPTRKLMMDVR